MFRKTTRVALMGSVAALMISSAYGQTNDQAEGELDQQACAALADRLAAESEIEADVRTNVEEVIASGDVTQCNVVVTAWDDEGSINRDTLELVATEQVTERMIVQQEIEVDADVSVYQPPAEVDVDTGTPEVVWDMPRQNVTINEEAPVIMVRQGQPIVNVELAQPRVTVMIPEPEITITWPDSTLDMSELEPMIEVRIPEPVVTVNMPDPVIELTIGGQGPSDLVELEDGRFAPQGATEEDLEPRIAIQQGEISIRRGQEGQAPEIVVNRGEPQVSYESVEPEVTVQIVGEPDIQVTTGNGDANVTIGEDAPRTSQQGQGEMDDQLEED